MGVALVEIVTRALYEDLAVGDVTSRCVVRRDRRSRARIIAREEVVMAGGGVVREVFRQVDPDVAVTLDFADGASVPAGARVARLEGRSRSLLAGERTALNLLQRACGIATMTRGFVARVEGASDRCKITDTRKTMPGLRALDRHAVRCGGGVNHRNDLGAGVLIKENHIRAAGGVRAAVSAARATAPHTLRICCEVATLEELDEALSAGADAVLLDNMDDGGVAEAVRRVAGRAVVEVSGGVELGRVEALARLGVDRISVGRLTHSVRAPDLSLLFDEDAALS
ncbi:MAG: carboxylating nicotinate-nucleotide diphosphorylase [Nannocystaceae bacterium]